ncbi:MAG: hypothetical protein IIT65_00600, partial [Lachnospiraceae bacterium]|nr:hypothetical protein [Lachnospiraceae bacterium]
LWSDMQRRAEGSDIRRENGVKVHTCLGIDVVLKDPSSWYDTLIKDFIESDDINFYIVNPRDSDITPDEMINVRKWEAPYDYLIYDGMHGTSLLARFYAYDDFDENDDIKIDFTRDDYIALCKCTATKLKEVGDSIESIPRNKCTFIDSSGGTIKDVKSGDDYALCLIAENEVFNWECEADIPDDYNVVKDFIECITDEFQELKETYFITYVYYQGVNISIPVMSMNNIMNFKKYKEYTKNWFTNEKVQ